MDVLSLEDRMMGYIHLNKQISSRAAVYARLALIADTDALSVVNTCGNCNLDSLFT